MEANDSLVERIEKALDTIRPFLKNDGGDVQLAEITPDMVGQKIAVFSVVEVKTGSLKLTDKQNRFKELILKMGGRFRELRSD